MDEAGFWALIDESHQGTQSCESQTERLFCALCGLSPDEIRSFDAHFVRFRDAAYRWDLWGVAHLINGGCSDDGFEYFRRWLVGQGRAVFDRALADPQSIGDLVSGDDDGLECEELMYAADRAYERVTGHEMPPTEGIYPREPAGEPWDEDDLEQRFPRLCQRL